MTACKRTVNYDDALSKRRELIQYAMRTSTHFSLLVRLERPYRQEPSIYRYCEELHPFEIRRFYEEKDRPVRILSRGKHQIMIQYRCCRASKELLLALSELLLTGNDETPEDLCFYRTKKPWLVSVTHEKLMFLFDETDDDIAFLNQNAIAYGRLRRD